MDVKTAEDFDKILNESERYWHSCHFPFLFQKLVVTRSAFFKTSCTYWSSCDGYMWAIIGRSCLTALVWSTNCCSVIFSTLPLWSFETLIINPKETNQQVGGQSLFVPCVIHAALLSALSLLQWGPSLTAKISCLFYCQHMKLCYRALSNRDSGAVQREEQRTKLENNYIKWITVYKNL